MSTFDIDNHRPPAMGPQLYASFTRLCLITEKPPQEIAARLMLLGFGVMLEELRPDNEHSPIHYFGDRYKRHSELDADDQWIDLTRVQRLLSPEQIEFIELDEPAENEKFSDDIPF